MQLQAVVLYLLASKLLARAGALLTLKRLNSESEFILSKVRSEYKKDRYGGLFLLI